MGGDPGAVPSLSRVVPRVFPEALLAPQGSASPCPFLRLCARTGPCRLPGGISPPAAQSLVPFGEDGVGELPRGFQMGAQPLRLPRGHLERQVQEKGRPRLGRARVLLCAGLPLPWHRREPTLPEVLNFCALLHHASPCWQAPAARSGGPSPACPTKERRFIPRIHHEGFLARFL
jgi:hypothetical protein